MRTNIIILAVLTISLGGCLNDADLTTTKDKSTPVNQKETVWTELAKFVDGKDAVGNAIPSMKPIDLIDNSSKLLLIVQRLRAVGAIDDNAVDSFKKKFDGIDAKEFSIAPGDAAKLRGIQ